MARIATRVAGQQDIHGLKGSPPRRRWTRSQSRELEAHPMDDVAAKKSSLKGNKLWKGKGKLSGHDLDVVTEESPVKPSRKLGFRAGQVIPESPEDVHNNTMSGSTIIVPEAETDQEDEDEEDDQDELGPELMLETLPSLERSAKDVLDFLVPGSADLKSIVNMAKRLSDPRNTQSKRLNLRKNALKNQPGWFEGRTYIDVTRASESLSSHFTKDGVLLASGNSTGFRKAIRDVEGRFPAPFMRDLVNGRRNAVGESALVKDTFQLALEIRTQALIMQLEYHQHEPSFDPNFILEDGFFLDVSVHEPIDSDNAPMRGFNLPRLNIDGSLPDEFREAASDRFEEMVANLPDEDGTFDIDDFKTTYSWRSFLLRAARWIRKRCEEIDQDISRQPSAESAREEFFAEIDAKNRRSSSVAGRSSLVSRHTEERSEQGTIASPDNRRVSAIPPATPRDSPRGVESKERRKSGKPAFLNKSSLERIAQRVKQPHVSIKDFEVRRRSDAAARPAPRNIHKESESQLRRQTLPAPRQSRPAVFEEATEEHVEEPAEEPAEEPTEEHIEERTEELIEEHTEEHIEEHTEDLIEEHTEVHTEEPTEVSGFREESPLLHHDERDVFNVDSESELSELFVGERAQLEKSHSPVMRRSREPRFATLSPVRTRLFATEVRLEPTSTQTSNIFRPIPSSQELWKAAGLRRDTTSTQTGNASRPLPSIQELWKVGNHDGPSRAAKKSEQASRFIDRQANAHRVSPISQSVDPQSAERRHTELQSKKRRRYESEDEESDGEFSNYNRPVDTARRRAEKPAQPNKRQRIEEHDESAAQLLNGLAETTRRTSIPESPEAAPRSTNPVRESPEAAPRSTNPVPVSSSARHTVTSTKVPVRWTPAEDKRLIRLIEEVGLGGPKGSGWCKVASQNEAQPVREGESRIEGRNQVQLKDRARNIKIRYLKDRKPLPSNFEHVTMKEKDRAMLAAKGINVT
ncbi:MYB DNA-binding domain protein [Aspergillus arachidicola]|uniref:MYB DNA-binding domain protein n=1 Tax=Aspergillus arachidicola TaxID=656916 RepID=A0A2G7FT58_9EURO|nr:MYB DNA-binding domain protein [Aspergillus arachidicola]